jgi:hypothetical protein
MRPMALGARHNAAPVHAMDGRGHCSFSAISQISIASGSVWWCGCFGIKMRSALVG